MLFSKAIVALLLPQLGLSLATPKPGNETAGYIPGTSSHHAKVRGQTYHYLLAEPTSPQKGTIFLLHGIPDLSYGWRYQIPPLAKLGYRVIAPDMLGYAGTDSPCSVTHWARKELAADMADLIGQLVPRGEQVIVGGHDWGAGLTYKVALWHPELVKAFFTIAIPYIPLWLGPTMEWVDMLDLVENGTFPTMGYQLQFRDEALERNVTSLAQIRSFLNGVYGGTTSDGKGAFSPQNGVDFDILDQLGPSPLVSSADIDFYAKRFHINGMRGPFNWYRTRRMDWEDELPFLKNGSIKYKMPVLFMPATKEPDTMPPDIWTDMGDYFVSLKIQELDSNHFAHWEAADKVNEALATWLPTLQ
ncbi:hypothetical protein V2G26_012544 [Clonostachys chloroleuca]